MSRRLDTADAVIIGMGAMIGTGVFVAAGPASASAGSGILLGLVIAAFVAFFNAASSAELAAVYPESGGAYVYGRKQLSPFWGWLAGWGFVVGKIASCAAAALTFGFYFYPGHAKALALGAVVLLTAVNYRGIHQTAGATRWILAVVLAALGAIVFSSLFGGRADIRNLAPLAGTGGLRGLLRAAAILFFAFAGYARIATLGEEVKEPKRAIPRAIVIALLIVLLIYFSVMASALLAVGGEALAGSNAPLALAVQAGRFARLSPVVRIGATFATLGVLLSLMVGVSRTVFSMASNRDLPFWFSAVHPIYKVPHRAEISVGLIIMVIVLLGDVRSAIGFSSFAILIYYAVTNASAWVLSSEDRLWPRWLSLAGLVSCVVLAVSLPKQTLLWGGAMMGLGSAIGLSKRSGSGG